MVRDRVLALSMEEIDEVLRLQVRWTCVDLERARSKWAADSGDGQERYRHRERCFKGEMGISANDGVGV